MAHSNSQKFVDAVVKVLDFGADKARTQEELDDFLKKQGIEPGVVHLRGENGLFEPDRRGTKYRLNTTAISILMSHRSIQQAKGYALLATWISIGALVIGIGAFIVSLSK